MLFYFLHLNMVDIYFNPATPCYIMTTHPYSFPLTLFDSTPQFSSGPFPEFSAYFYRTPQLVSLSVLLSATTKL